MHRENLNKYAIDLYDENFLDYEYNIIKNTTRSKRTKRNKRIIDKKKSEENIKKELKNFEEKIFKVGDEEYNLVKSFHTKEKLNYPKIHHLYNLSNFMEIYKKRKIKYKITDIDDDTIQNSVRKIWSSFDQKRFEKSLTST